MKTIFQVFTILVIALTMSGQAFGNNDSIIRFSPEELRQTVSSKSAERVAKGVCNPELEDIFKQSAKCIESTVNIFCKKGKPLGEQDVNCIGWLSIKIDYEYYRNRKIHPLEAAIKNIKELLKYEKELAQLIGRGSKPAFVDIYSIPYNASTEQKRSYCYVMSEMQTDSEGNSLYYALRDLMEYSGRLPSEEILESSHPQDYLHFKPTKPPNPEVTKLLIEVLTEWPTPAGRAMAADYIATNDDPSAVPALIKALHTEKNVYALITIASALTKYGKRDAVIPVFIQAWNTEQNVKERIAIAEVLIEHGKEDVVLPTLKKFMRSHNTKESDNVMDMIQLLGDKNLKKKLLLIAIENQNVWVVRGLAANILLTEFGDVNVAKRVAIEILKNDKDNDKDGLYGRNNAIYILGHIGGDESIKLLEEYLNNPVTGGVESTERIDYRSSSNARQYLDCLKKNKGKPCTSIH
ncbi:MAG: HEAT repeat domain-containing protein [Deltaproteobacteria bacterium]|nr:HEAT repeat domain-containing protein [Deltaproteobacteria bacterium]